LRIPPAFASDLNLSLDAAIGDAQPLPMYHTDEREATEPSRHVPTVGGGKVAYAWDYETPEITEEQLAARDKAMAKLAEMVAAKTM
jgi:hypothetical protein